MLGAMDPLLEPFQAVFVQRAALAGALTATICALAGTWIVVRGLAFLGEALSHGVLPGIALASLGGLPALLGGAASAAVMAGGIQALRRSRRIGQDTAIGLLFVGMLALGVVIISHSEAFATDLTGILFGEILAVRDDDLRVLLAAAAVTIVGVALAHRPLLASAGDPLVARALGYRPGIWQAVLLGLLTLAITSGFHAVGTLLVVGLLLAPPATALLLVRRLPLAIVTAAALGTSAVLLGLLASWHAGTAAGASIVLIAVAQFALAWALSLRRRPHRRSPALSAPLARAESPA